MDDQLHPLYQGNRGAPGDLLQAAAVRRLRAGHMNLSMTTDLWRDGKGLWQLEVAAVEIAQ